MRKTSHHLNLPGIMLLAGIVISGSCRQALPTGYRTYSLPDKGIAHLSFDYPASFNVRQVELYDDTGYERMDIDGPFSRTTRDRTTMWVVAQRYSTPITIADLVQNSVGVAQGLSGYVQKDRSTISFNGITAEQFAYFYYSTRTDYETKILGLTPAPTVTREIFFSYGGLDWTIGITADENSASSDTPGFEHLLNSLVMLP